MRATSGAMPSGAIAPRVSGKSQRRCATRVISSTSFSWAPHTMTFVRRLLLATALAVACAPTPGVTGSWSAGLSLDGVVPGDQRIEVLVRLATGEDAVLATRDFKASAGEYVVWTLDFEGDAASDVALGNTAAIADRFG